MNHSPTEDRLREALTEAGATLDPSTLRPLRAPERRFRLNHRLLIAVAAVVLAGTATAVGLGGPGEVDYAVATNPESLPPEETDLAIFLCTESVQKDPCQGRAADPEQTRTIEETIRRSPDVEVMTFESDEAAYGRFRQEYAENKALLAAVKPTDILPSFRVKVHEGTDLRQTVGPLHALPGVAKLSEPARLYDLPAMNEKTQRISVFICVDGSAMPACGAQRTSGSVTKEGKAATKAQKEAVEQMIAQMPEVESFFFEDQEAAYRNFLSSYKSNRTLVEATEVEDMPESFRLTMRATADRSRVVSDLKRQPGVAQVVDHACTREQIALERYGLDLPAAEACSKGP
ncbi:permease-like cell division protein FtsX [Nonomuraea sp. KM88]|uniref:permease-like cell division protein FtsX n=1 Tax=Nonomuraea sp. KM88 TaxID=3457427 RepID=UPI003FCD5C97